MVLQELRRGGKPNPKAALNHSQFFPEPRIKLGQWLGQRGSASAMIDLSDGLSTDLTHLCVESGVGARVTAAMIPVDDSAALIARAQGEDALRMAVEGGEDYQLLAAVPRDRFAEVSELGGVWNLPIVAVGEFVEGADLVIEQKGGDAPLTASGFDHFRGGR